MPQSSQCAASPASPLPSLVCTEGRPHTLRHPLRRIIVVPRAPPQQVGRGFGPCSRPTRRGHQPPGTGLLWQRRASNTMLPAASAFWMYYYDHVGKACFDERATSSRSPRLTTSALAMTPRSTQAGCAVCLLGVCCIARPKAGEPDDVLQSAGLCSSAAMTARGLPLCASGCSRAWTYSLHVQASCLTCPRLRLGRLRAECRAAAAVWGRQLLCRNGLHDSKVRTCPRSKSGRRTRSQH